MKRLFTLIAFFAVSTVFAGGPWLPGKGKGFFKLEQRWIIADQFYNPAGEIVPITTTSVYISSLYGEYGLSDKIGVELYAPFFFRTTLNEVTFNQSGRTEPGDELNSVGDFNLGIKYQLVKKDAFVMAASLTFGIPSGKVGGGDTQLLQTGDGEFNQLLKVDAGYSFWPKPVYVSAGIGVNNRTENFSDELHFSAEIGYTYKNLTAILKLYGVQSFENGSDEVQANGIFSNNTEYISYGPELIYTFKEKWGITGNIGYATAGQNILARPAYAVGAFLKL